VTPEAGLGFWGRSSQFDPFLYRMAEFLVDLGDAVWDVGANVGLFSFCAGFAAGSGGSVLAIEPDLILCRLLRKSYEANRKRLGKFSVLEAAISDCTGIAQLEISPRSRAMNRITQFPNACSVPPLTVPIVTLDSLLEKYPPPSVLKIDVEGHELQVLRGATRVLAEVRPAIWCEVSHEHSRDVAKLLRGAGYLIKSARTGQTTEYANWDTLAVPA
jgi:FkbM family methyltransferase